MAVKTLVRTTCDRCDKLIEEVPNASTGETRTGKPLVYVEARDIDPIRFDDLCARCLPRTVSLLKQLRREKEEKGDKKGDSKDTSSSPKSGKKSDSNSGGSNGRG